MFTQNLIAIKKTETCLMTGTMSSLSCAWKLNETQASLLYDRRWHTIVVWTTIAQTQPLYTV